MSSPKCYASKVDGRVWRPDHHPSQAFLRRNSKPNKILQELIMTRKSFPKIIGSIGRTSSLWLTAWLILGGAFWLTAQRSTPPQTPLGPTKLTSLATASPSSLPSISQPLKAIEQIRVGDRVGTFIDDEIRQLAIGDPQAAPSWDRLDAAIDPASWRQVSLVMATAEDRFDITLLRPVDWLEACQAAVGAEIQLTIPEQGLDGPATVLAMDPCPALPPGLGRIVTGTFTHIRDGILSLTLDGVESPIGVTANHPIFSVERNDFVLAEELHVGESLRTLEGTIRIASIERLTEEARVFNLEVHGEHVYHVSADGILVHNSCESTGGTRSTVTSSIRDLRSSKLKDAHHVIQDAAVRDLPGYDTNAARGVVLEGPANVRGTPHHATRAVQRELGGGTYASERRIGYKALRRAGFSEEQARQAIKEADRYFNSIGVGPDTRTRIPADRR
jgi:hypothetical protein